MYLNREAYGGEAPEDVPQMPFLMDALSEVGCKVKSERSGRAQVDRRDELGGVEREMGLSKGSIVRASKEVKCFPNASLEGLGATTWAWAWR